MKLKNKTLTVILLAIIVIAGFALQKGNSDKALAAGEATGINGYAWSDNIGWVQMGGFAGSVKMDLTTGDLSGYAWSDNIGWISFQPTDIVSCPSVPCQPNINKTTGVVSGWARVLSIQSGSGGWNGLGWISLSGTGYGLKYDVSPSGTSGIALPQDSNKWAWSDDFGWFDFSQTSLGNMTVFESDTDYIYTDNYKYPKGIIVNTYADINSTGNSAITKGVDPIYYILEISNQGSVDKKIDLKFTIPNGFTFSAGSVTCTAGINPCGDPTGMTLKTWSDITVPAGMSTVKFKLNT